MQDRFGVIASVLTFAVIGLTVGPMLVFEAYRAASLSMDPTLQVDERFFVAPWADAERGDIIVFEPPPGMVGRETNIVSRVVGVGGDVIELRDGVAVINDGAVADPNPVESETSARTIAIPGCAEPEAVPDRCVIHDDAVFVMGDNRQGSSDSRVFGPVSRDAIQGVRSESIVLVLARLLP